ncbi:MAG: O-antigen ligase family protein [Acidobacteria bacterium]|nr:O-antigen ligase family protein [Acidobacteriota bacterium]
MSETETQISNPLEAFQPGNPTRTSSAIFVLLCIIPAFATVLFGAVDSATWVIISIFWAVLVCLWLADGWSNGGLLFNKSSLQIPLVTLLLLGIVQLLPLGSGSSSLSLDQYSTRFFVIRLIIFSTFFAAALAYINSEKRLKRIVVLIVIFGATMAFFGILQRLANPDGIYGMRLTPQAIPFGPFVNQHHFAALMQMTGGLTLALLLGRDTPREKKYLLAIALVISGIAVALTGSRGGLLGFLAMASFGALLTFMSGRKSRSEEKAGVQREVIFAAGSLGFGLVIIGTALLIGGNDQVLRGIGAVSADADVSTGRLHFWPIALKIFLANPLIGAGFDAFAVAFTRYDTWSGLMRVEQAHNEYLQMLAEGGLVAIGCVAMFIFLLFKKGLKVVSSTKGFRQSAAIGSLAGCLGIMVHSFFDFPLRTNSNMFVLLLMAAIATVTVAVGEHHHHRHRRH